MRLDINLASRPYRDIRQFLITWGAATALLCLLTLGLCWHTVDAWRQSRVNRRQIAEQRSQITKLDEQRAAGIALLNQPQNRDVVEQSEFLNALIARRSFSWTRLFMELERIMPARLHVNSISPSLNKKNQIEVHMRVGGDSREQAQEFLKRIEASPSFRDPTLAIEELATQPGGDRIRVDIASLYVPHPVENAEQEEGPKQTAAAVPHQKPVIGAAPKPARPGGRP